jgi:hypothetical protein
MPPRRLPLATAQPGQGEERRGGAGDCGPSHANHPGTGAGGHSDHGYVVKRRPSSNHAAAVGGPAVTTRDFLETDPEPERDTVSGQGQDLVPEHGVRDVPGAPGGVGAFLQFDGDADGQGADVAGMGGGEGTRLGSVAARAPRSNVSVTRRPWSTTRAGTPHGRSGPTRVRLSPFSRIARVLVKCRV